MEVGGGGGKCTYINKHFYSSRRTPAQNYFEIHAYIEDLWPRKAHLCDLQV